MINEELKHTLKIGKEVRNNKNFIPQNFQLYSIARVPYGYILVYRNGSLHELRFR